MSLLRPINTANKLPACKIRSNDTDWICQLNNIGIILKCAELEIGKNSVIPCNIPNMIACKVDNLINY